MLGLYDFICPIFFRSLPPPSPSPRLPRGYCPYPGSFSISLYYIFIQNSFLRVALWPGSRLHDHITLHNYFLNIVLTFLNSTSNYMWYYVWSGCSKLVE